MSFRRDMQKAQARVTGEAERKIRAASLQLFSQIIERTPVDTGHLRGNWQTGFSETPEGVLERKDKSGAAAMADAAQAVGRFQITGVLRFVNNLPYAPVIERGSSKQAPGGMVAISVNNFREAFRNGGFPS